MNCRLQRGYECSKLDCHPVCGDGLVTAPETCDNDHVGCLSCTTRTGYLCDPVANLCRNICGDGLQVVPEECDTNQTGCRNCGIDPGYHCVDNQCGATCGDNVIVTPEECDIGNASAVSADGCVGCLIYPGMVN
jgi:cysteine-rich repeat protein